ncbi:MAG: hypothetical protein BGO43_15645 [Gammaproteobacteria bacterium 39-13]|nr:MAG: hypothetical protein BGO43_15645 [Gammaproteobacteria bacterium 39-13]
MLPLFILYFKFMKRNFFERYPKLTLFGVSALLISVSLFFANMAGEKFFGLGKIVVYQSHPVYGYRPIPNQIVARNPQQIIKINNLGLRAEEDWVEGDFHRNILFLGDSVTYGGSYISNEELFSYQAVKDFTGYTAGNAGVNAWGINNVHALVKEMEFLPAQIYVSVFPEGDFYRGLTRIGGQPFWTRKPNYALEELLQYIVYQIHLQKTPAVNYAALEGKEKTKIIESAVSHLKRLDIYLNQNERNHLIYITPSRSQLLGLSDIDEAIRETLEKYHVKVVYLRDHLADLPEDKIKALYHDEIHLTAAGHKMWAEVIKKDLQEIILQNETKSILVQKAHENKNT